MPFSEVSVSLIQYTAYTPSFEHSVAGDHTRTIQIATPTIGGLMKFAVKTLVCLGCKTPLRTNKGECPFRIFSQLKLNTPASATGGAVCENCRPRLGELYQKQVATTSALAVDFARLWTQCQRCQGSLTQDVLCQSADCPIFYRRTARQKEVKAAVDTMARFKDEQGW